MKKNLLFFVLCAAAAVPAFAWHHPGPPPPPCHPWGPGHGGYYRGSSGLWEAAAITSIVANGIDIARTLSYPANTTVVVPAAAPSVVTAPAPVVVSAPVYTTPVYMVQQPAPAYVVQQPAPSYVVQQAPLVQTAVPAGTVIVQNSGK